METYVSSGGVGVSP
ncbi:hypothetical protein [Stygiolobus sp. CP850M]